MQSLKQFARKLKQEIYIIYLASKDPRIPWYVRLLAAIVAAYAFSPIDLIPDPIPVLGYLDDLILIPLGIWLVVKLIPPSILSECREKAEAAKFQNKPTNWIAAAIILALWLAIGVLIVLWLRRFLGR